MLSAPLPSISDQSILEQQDDFSINPQQLHHVSTSSQHFITATLSLFQSHSFTATPIHPLTLLSLIFPAGFHLSIIPLLSGCKEGKENEGERWRNTVDCSLNDLPNVAVATWMHFIILLLLYYDVTLNWWDRLMINKSIKINLCTVSVNTSK